MNIEIGEIKIDAIKVLRKLGKKIEPDHGFYGVEKKDGKYYSLHSDVDFCDESHSVDHWEKEISKSLYKAIKAQEYLVKYLTKKKEII